MQTSNYLKRLFDPLHSKSEKAKRSFNPISPAERTDATEVKICVYNFDENTIEEKQWEDVQETFNCKNNGKVTWINIDGIRQRDVDRICSHFGIHNLIEEDILSIGQRPKMDEIDDIMYCLMNMLYFNTQSITVEQEQISVILGKDFVITFQEDAKRDVFDGLREKLKVSNSKLRTSRADYLAYALIDTIVDNYFAVMDRLSDKLEAVEEEIIHSSNVRSLAHTNKLRKELIVLRRNVLPVRDMINSLIRSDSPLLNERVMRYFKDVSDHITQAADMVENYRDMMMNMQDLYLNKANIKLNEVMKVMAIVTCLMAPATVIGGIFGMNFENIPFLKSKDGFYGTVAVMLIIPVYMIFLFKKRGWFRKV